MCEFLDGAFGPVNALLHSFFSAVKLRDRNRVVIPTCNTHKRTYGRPGGKRSERVLRARAYCQRSNGARLHERHRRYEIRSCKNVADFPCRYLSLRRDAATLSKSSKIESECGVATFSEPLRVHRRHLFFDCKPRTRHDDGRLPVEPVLCISIKAPDQWYTVTEEENGIAVNHKRAPQASLRPCLLSGSVR